MTTVPDPDALFVALVLAPATFSRNKFFELYQEADLARARRRAQVVRSVIKDLTEPWAHPGKWTSHPIPQIEEERTEGGNLHLTYRVEGLDYRRYAVLTQVEAAALRYALHRTTSRSLDEADKNLVEAALAKMNPVG